MKREMNLTILLLGTSDQMLDKFSQGRRLWSKLKIYFIEVTQVHFILTNIRMKRIT